MKTQRILFGTSNASKIHRIRSVVKNLLLEVIGPKDINIHIDVTESGFTAEENAFIKAQAYYNASKIPTFSIDSSLYIDKFPEHKQPGPYVRRINGQRATDDEMIAYYSQELAKVGGISKGRWVSAVVFVLNENWQETFELIDERVFTSKLSSVRTEGAPLSSMSIDPTFNKYVSEITAQERQRLQEDTDREIYKIFKDLLNETR